MSTYESDRVLEGIPRDKCLSYLTTKHVGRLGVVTGEGPMIVPVNYAVEEGTIVIRSDAGTKLENAPLERVAFEVDEIDEPGHEGWSVLVSGSAIDITEANDPVSEHLRKLPLDSWAPGPKNHWLKIVPTMITGRRLAPSRHASRRGRP